ncbi:hypothetical protein [Mycobacterium avium]|uniref:hypothetical protein n=1 Tax=Mycobacterium avium TaxID=1764 RepID=UPI0002FB64FF|nr:hypothetical protein [Mycobacterium avium]
MRIRSTKPEFWRSERIAAVSWEDRLVLKVLESYVDDNGVGRDDVALIVGEVFPRDMLANPRIGLQWFPSRADGFAAERAAILAERPLYNTARPRGAML